MPSSFFIVSLDMVSFFMLSLDIVSFFMPSSLPILSWAKAAGASARLSERAAAESPSERREVIWVILRELVGQAARAALLIDAAAAAFVTRRLKFFRVSGFLPPSAGFFSAAATQFRPRKTC